MPTIEADPFDYPFDHDTVALIVIDMQRDFIEPGGFGETLGNDVSRLSSIVPTVRALLDAFRSAQLPIIHTRECHRPDLSDLPLAKRDRGNPSLKIGEIGPMGRILISGEPGAEIIDALSPMPGELVMDKPGKGAFYGTGLGKYLTDRGIKQLVFAGVTTEVCVQTSMREANDRGYDCLLATDATASYFPEFKASTIEMITAQGGIVGWAAPSASVLGAIHG
ncbi:MAG: isochorismatase family cysteine hydrolase [Pseudomonadota bacterium]